MLHLDFERHPTLINRKFTIFEATSTFRIAITPVAYVILYVRFTALVRAGQVQYSARDATLDTGEWLTLTRQGLSPCKKCQALLGAQIAC